MRQVACECLAGLTVSLLNILLAGLKPGEHDAGADVTFERWVQLGLPWDLLCRWSAAQHVAGQLSVAEM
jgi:hypothetical protein